MIKTDRLSYGSDSVKWFIDNIDDIRTAVQTGPRMLAGRRFKDNGHVLSVLESTAPEEDFVYCPISSIRKALEECARADWWYENEKDYGSDLVTKPHDCEIEAYDESL